METEQQFLDRISKLTDAEISQEFLEEYRKLCQKYKRDFYFEPIVPKIVKLEFAPEIPPELPKEAVK